MSETDKGYELKVLKMVVNKYLDETISVTEESLKILEVNRDQVVWELSTRIYSQSGHKIELSIVRDVVNSRIGVIKYQLAAEKERMAAEKERMAEQLRNEINSILGEFGGDVSKAKIFVRVRKIVSEQLSVDESKVTLNRHISNELGADEIDTVELAMALEEEFDIVIPENLLGSVKKWPSSYSYNSLGDSVPRACTVKELLNFIHDRVLP